MYIKRHAEETIVEMSKMFKVLLITGSRQVGKTTMLKNIFKNYKYVSLDDALLQVQIKQDPALFFNTYKLPIIIDEVQKASELFPYIKMIVDNSDKKGQIILTGY